MTWVLKVTNNLWCRGCLCSCILYIVTLLATLYRNPQQQLSHIACTLSSLLAHMLTNLLHLHTLAFNLYSSSDLIPIKRYSLSAQNIYIEDFGKSFSNGLAFCAILHHFIPHKIPYSTLDDTDKVSHTTLISSTNSLLFVVYFVKQSLVYSW